MASITLTPELEQVMTEQARIQGTTLEMLALDKLNAYFLPDQSAAIISEGETMADFFEGYAGAIDSREIAPEGVHLSKDTGRRFKEIMLQRYQSGKL